MNAIIEKKMTSVHHYLFVNYEYERYCSQWFIKICKMCNWIYGYTCHSNKNTLLNFFSVELIISNKNVNKVAICQNRE